MSMVAAMCVSVVVEGNIVAVVVAVVVVVVLRDKIKSNSTGSPPNMGQLRFRRKRRNALRDISPLVQFNNSSVTLDSNSSAVKSTKRKGSLKSRRNIRLSLSLDLPAILHTSETNNSTSSALSYIGESEALDSPGIPTSTMPIEMMLLHNKNARFNFDPKWLNSNAVPRIDMNTHEHPGDDDTEILRTSMELLIFSLDENMDS